MLNMRKSRLAIWLFSALLVIGPACDYLNVRRKENRLVDVVDQLGGKTRSIPAWPLGTEYQITLPRVPDSEELKRLAIANQLRGWVGIAFDDCQISQQQKMVLERMLSRCRLFVLEGDRLQPLRFDESQ